MAKQSDPKPSNNGRQASGKFALGNRLSNGRKPGSRNRTTLAALNLLDHEAESLSRRAIDMALSGDVAALKLCLDKVAPPRRDRLIEIEMERIESAADACSAISDLIEAVAAGELAPSEADAVAGLIERRARLAELSDIEQRLSALEKAAG
jgi:hypothetical protein